MLGQSSPIDPVVKFADDVKALRAEVAELKRLLGVAKSLGDVSTATTDSNGFVIVTHGLSFTPDRVIASPRSTNHSQHIVDNVGATTFRYRALTSAGSAVASTPVTFQWEAFR